MSRPKLLDLYCCEGGASVGYFRAGFEVYGVDLFDSHSAKRYPFAYYQGDALTVLDPARQHLEVPFRCHDGTVEHLALRQFDAIHASPPCQHASAGTRAQDRSRYPALIEPTRTALQATGRPYVIENVKGAALDSPLTLCGSMFDLRATDDDGTPLRLERHRLFESNVLLYAPAPCRHDRQVRVGGSYGGARRDKDEARYVRRGGYVPSIAVQRELLGINWMTQKGMHQALPPAYTQWLGEQLVAALAHGGAA